MFLSIVKSVGAVLAASALVAGGNGLLGTLLGVNLGSVGVTGFLAGIVMSCFFVGLTLGSLKASSVIGAVGHIRAFAAFASVYSAATLIHAVIVDPAAWAVLRVISGFCAAGLYMCVESWLNDRATPSTRGVVFSVYMMTIHLALGGSQFILAAGGTDGFALFVVASVLLSLALVPISLTRNQAPTLPEVSSFGLKKLIATSPVGVVGALLGGVVIGAIYGMLPVQIAGTGATETEVSLLMAAAVLGGLLVQHPLGRLSDRMDRRIVIAVAFAGVAVCAVASWLLWDNGLAARVLAIGFFGGFSFAIYPLCLSHASDHVGPADMVGLSGGLILASSVGSAAGPIAVAAFMDAVGSQGFFIFSAAAAIVGGVFSLARMAIRSAPSTASEDWTPFSGATISTPVAAALDARGEPEQLEFDFGYPREAA